MSQGRATGVLKRALLVIVAICFCALTGCVEWTQDPHGNLQSIGVPGLPLWQSKKPPEPPTPSEMGYTPEEASKLGGPILVEPPVPPLKAYRYRYYQIGQNNCQEDLQRMLAERAASNATGLAPYCTETSSATTTPSATTPSADTSSSPPVSKGNAFVF